MKRQAICLIAVLWSAVAASAAPGKAAAPLATIPLKPYVGHIVSFDATINGKPGSFLFDTGGGITVLSPDIMKAVGCKPWGQVTGFRMTAERLDAPHCDNLTITAGGTTFALPVAIQFDIMKLLGPGAPPIDGSAGMDIFAGQVISIIPGKAIIVESPQSLEQRVAGSKPFPVRLVRDAEGVALTANAPVKTPAGTAWMEIDTGNNAGALIANHIAPLVGLKPDDKTGAPVKLELGNGLVLEGKSYTRDLIMDGNIGAPLLSSYVLTLDLAGSRGWLTPLPK